MRCLTVKFSCHMELCSRSQDQHMKGTFDQSICFDGRNAKNAVVTVMKTCLYLSLEFTFHGHFMLLPLNRFSLFLTARRGSFG